MAGLFAPPPGRGGPQHIPRPSDAELGGPPPWSELPESDRRLSLDALATQFDARRPPANVGLMAPTTRESAVLCVLYEEAGEPHVVLTRRSPRMRSHAHEVSFPGGRKDEADPDLWCTALREAEEEVALDPSSVTCIGELDRFVTVGSQSLIHPFVAVAQTKPDLHVASPAEVEAIVHVALGDLLRDEVWREEIWGFREYGVRALTFFEIEGDTIWGATGSMLRQLLAIATGTDARILGGPG